MSPSHSERCRNCRYFNDNPDKDDVDECRRYPPTLVWGESHYYARVGQSIMSAGREELQTHPATVTAYPEMEHNDWCGEFKAAA